MNSKVLHFNNIKVFWILAILCIGLFSMYFFFINQISQNAAHGEAGLGTLSNLEYKVSELEFSYISLKNNIDLSLAHSLGFIDTSKTSYVSRTALGQATNFASVQ